MARRIDKLSTTLARILKSRGLEGRLHEYRIFGLWDRTVGTAIARHAQPRALRGKKLALVVDSPAWMQQLTLMKPELIEKLNRSLGRETIGDLTMRLGEVAHSGRPEEADEKPAGAELSAEEREKIARYVQGVEDDTVREAIMRLFGRAAQNEKRK